MNKNKRNPIALPPCPSFSVRCLGLFATHYHRLSDMHARDDAVAIKHMACAVAPAEVRPVAMPPGGARAVGWWMQGRQPVLPPL